MVTRVIQFFCFLDKPMKGGDILDFSKGGNLRKEGLDLERGGRCMTPLPTMLVLKFISSSEMISNSEKILQILATEIPLKMMKNAFYFNLEALFVLKIFKFLS